MSGVYQGFQEMLKQGLDCVGTLPRYRLVWVAGQRGKPGLNADMTPASADDAADGATKAELDTMNMTDPDFEILGTNATSALCTHCAEGGISLTTAGADADQEILLPHLNTSQSAWTAVTWGTDQATRWECRLKSGTAAEIADCIIWAGLKLTNTAVVATDADAVFLRYEDDVNSGRWEAVSAINNVDDEHDTGIVLVASTDYHLVVNINEARIVQFFINGILVETAGPLTTAVDLIPYIAVEADGAAAAKSIDVRGQAISRKFA